MLPLTFMPIAPVFAGLGEESAIRLLRQVSLGKLKTYQMFDRLKTRLRVSKLNAEALRKCGPKVWERLLEGDEDLAADLSQAILVSHMEMIVAVLDFLGIPHQDGFFAKDLDAAQYLTEGWRERCFNHFQDKHDATLLVFYLNHLGAEMTGQLELFVPAALPTTGS